MEILVNGETVTTKEGITLDEFIRSQGYEKNRIAAEVNGEIVTKASYAECKLGPADKLEIVTFVGGG